MAKYTKSEVDKMTSEQYRNLFDTDPEFRVYIDGPEYNAPRTATRPNGSVRQEPAQPATFDPSFDLDDEQPAPALAPAAVAEPAQSAAVTDFSQLPILEHSYQPEVTDKKTGKVTPIGGRQVFRYRTVSDLADENSLVKQLEKAHANASAKIRTLSRDKALENISASGAAPRFEPEAELPTTLEGLGAELKAQRQQSFLLSVRAALAEFQAGVDWSKYRHDPENGKSLVLAIERLGLSPAEPASYLQAMEHMREYLREAPAPVVPVVEQPKAAVVEQPKAAAASVRPRSTPLIATGLSNADGGNDYTPTAPLGQTPKGIVVDGVRVTSIAQWDKIPSSKQRRILIQPALNLIVNQMYEQQAAVLGGPVPTK